MASGIRADLLSTVKGPSHISTHRRGHHRGSRVGGADGRGGGCRAGCWGDQGGRLGCAGHRGPIGGWRPNRLLTQQGGCSWGGAARGKQGVW